MDTNIQVAKPSSAFVAAAWAGLIIGVGCFLLGLWNAGMQLNEKGFYLAVLLFGLYSAVSVQKSVRDKDEGIAVSNIYMSITYFAVLAPIVLLLVGLYNADLLLSEKGFYGIAFLMSMFAVIVVQKNTRDSAAFQAQNPGHEEADPLIVEAEKL
jgi:uncharacterized membrane protein YiaA